MKFVDLSGKKFGRLLVISRAENLNGRVTWLCSCDCGNKKIVQANKLANGHTKSCGCLLPDRNRQRLKRHGHAAKNKQSLTYSTYLGMHTRCENENAINFERYGGAGVDVCERWKSGEGNLSGFECFLKDMGERPALEYSIDRIDNSKGYDVNNCRWASVREQVLNRRNTVMVDVSGYPVPLSVACELSGIKYATAWQRIKRGQHWSDV